MTTSRNTCRTCGLPLRRDIKHATTITDAQLEAGVAAFEKAQLTDAHDKEQVVRAILEAAARA